MLNAYILRSKGKNRFYIGSTKDIENRLNEHNSGEVKSTKAYKPWEVVYTEDLQHFQKQENEKSSLNQKKQKVH